MKKSKPVPIYHGDKLYSTVYPKGYKKGKFKDTITKITKVVVLIAIIFALANILSSISPKIITKVEVKEVLIDNLTDKINQLKQEVVDTIRICESKGSTEEDAIITFDPHPTKKSVKLASIGQFQFKTDTIKYYYKLLYDKDLTTKEAVLIALDTPKAEALAKDIIFKGTNKANDWYDCSNKHNINDKLEVINNLSK